MCRHHYSISEHEENLAIKFEIRREERTEGKDHFIEERNEEESRSKGWKEKSDWWYEDQTTEREPKRTRQMKACQDNPPTQRKRWQVGGSDRRFP